MKLRIDTAHWSLTRRQLVVIGSALTFLALLLGVGGAWFIGGVAERTSDRTLAASAHSIVDMIGVEHGEVTLEIPPTAFGMLEDRARDNVYYSIYQGSRFLTGYRSFPKASIEGVVDGTPVFRYDRFLDQRVRVVTEIRRLPQSKDPVVVQIAETLDERSALARSMMLGLVLLEVTLVGFAIFLVWPAIRWGLRPVIDMRGQIEARDPHKVDFTPLDERNVPPELTGLIDAFNQMLTHLGSATERSRRFTADASHQLRTPVAILRAHIEVLQKDEGHDAATAAAIRDIREATERLQRLLTQLLSLARAEQELPGSEKPLSDARDVARNVATRMAPEALAAGLDLDFEAPTTFEVRLEPILLEELLSNLIDNAIRYNTCGTRVTVRTGMTKAACFIEVEDDGPGIPVEDRPFVVERFSRLPRDQQKAGSGLGLSIALAICERAGATLGFSGKAHPQAFAVRLSFSRT